jgi:nucleotide-binding universal stress UspA family protein
MTMHHATTEIPLHPAAATPARGDGTNPVRIVVATDFSQASSRALQWTEAIATGRSAEVTVVHAIDPTPLGRSPEAADLLVQRAEERVVASCSSLAMRGIRVAAHCAIGRPWSVVRDAIDRTGADLVIVGNRGLSPIKRTLLGSNADRVLRTAQCPALVVHAMDMQPERLRVLIATDFSIDAEEAISAFRRVFVRSAIRLELRVLHVTIPPESLANIDTPLLEGPDWPSIESDATESVARVAEEFRAHGIETSHAVVRGSAARIILAESRAWRADLLVMGRHGQTGFERFLMGSTAERVLHGAMCAVFTAQKTEAPARTGVKKALIA